MRVVDRRDVPPTSVTRRGPTPADGLLHPAALLALGALILNDHVLKAAWPGLVTGKLSDVAGLIVFPLFLQGAIEVGQWLAGHWHGPDFRLVAACAAATVVVFALVKTVPSVTQVYESTQGLLQWLPTIVAATLTGAPVADPPHVRLVADATDLVCLPTAGLALWVGRRRAAIG
jgi:hypothetical protein